MNFCKYIPNMSKYDVQTLNMDCMNLYYYGINYILFLCLYSYDFLVNTDKIHERDRKQIVEELPIYRRFAIFTTITNFQYIES